MAKKKKIKVGIIFGGRTAEHEVSLQSAKNVIEAINRDKYEVVLIGLDKEGKWRLLDEPHFLLNVKNPKLFENSKQSKSVALVPQGGGEIDDLISHRPGISIDVAFPILHGPYGEDGTVQGLLKLADVPFVGASVLGSAISMDKDVMNRLLREAGIPIAGFEVVRHSDKKPDYQEVVRKLGSPFFIKPANLGSSVGISKVKSEKEFSRALDGAFQYDTKILIEEYIEGREIECSVLGNEHPIASIPGEVMPKHEFYSYEAKYIDEEGAVLQVPADISNSAAEKIKNLAIKAFTILSCEGMARVDFFLRRNGEVLVNELNTIPGFTSISMYPRMWAASGISYSELIDKLIQLGIERHKREKQLKTIR